MSNPVIPVTLVKRGSLAATGTYQLDVINDVAAVRPKTGGNYVVVLARPLSGKGWNENTLTIEESPAEILSLCGSYNVDAPLVQFSCTKVDTIPVTEEILLNMKYCKPEAFGDGSKIFSYPNGEANVTVYTVTESPEEILEETGGSSGS